jgi:hypothetical protein
MGGACGTMAKRKILTEEKRLLRKPRLSLEGNIKMVDFSLWPRRNRYPRFRRILRSVEWWFLTDVSGHPSHLILKGQGVQPS